MMQWQGLQLPSTGQDALVLSERQPKRWAPKSKTGCTQCRIRRVKCDETAPACKRCLSNGRHCEYPLPPQHSAQTASRRHNKCITSEYLVVPPDWNYSEICRYYLQVTMPARQGELDHDKMPYDPEHFNFPQRFRPSFTMSVLAEYIINITRAKNRLSWPWETPEFHQSRVAYHSNAMLTIQDINRLLEDLTAENKVRAMSRITDICDTELGLSSWRAHVTGFLALARHIDGINGINDTRNMWFHARAKQYHLIRAVIGNTVSPAHNQIQQIYEIETEQLRDIYTFDLFGEMPCPTVLFLDIIRITRLRMTLAAGASFEFVIHPAAQDIFEHVNDFSPEDWTEPYTVPERPEFPLLASIFKSAVTLYGILSLSPRDSDAYQLTRPVIRDNLLGLIRQVLTLLRCKLSLAWPISVVLVALVDGAPEDIAMIEELLCSGSPENYFRAPLVYIKRLREFWASGKTAWDDCYHVPFHPLA